ncbi:MAG: hypothetical protein RLZZ232_770 [Planctomycetota bacterium]|jgi:hypothetical protein
MKKMILGFVRGEEGFLLSTEALLIGTIAVLGLIVGLAEVRNAVVQELGDFSQAVAFLTQDYNYTSVQSANDTDISTFGASYVDGTDTQRPAAEAANGVSVTTAGVASE